MIVPLLYHVFDYSRHINRSTSGPGGVRSLETREVLNLINHRDYCASTALIDEPVRPRVSGHDRKSSFEEDHLKDSIEHVESMSVQDALESIESTRVSKYAWLVSITAGVGGFLFGYDTVSISSILVVLGDDLGQSLNSKNKELIT